MIRYFKLMNPETLEVYLSEPTDTQPENSLPFEPIDFFKPCFDQYPNPTAIVEGATPEEILEARPVPDQVPLWALKATLDLENKLGAVEAALDQLPEIVKKKAYWIWEYGNFIHRNSQTVGFIGQVLGMNKTEIDTLFINAENIEL
jgi:hypothetical protein